MRHMPTSAKGCIRSCRGAVALLLVMCGVAACGQPRTSAHSPTATTPPTATPVPQLAFHPATLPTGFSNQGGSFAISPVDGRVAWACSQTGNGSFSIWMTADETATWRVAGSLNPKAPMATDACTMLPDERDVHAAVFMITWGAGEAGDLASMSLYTRDGGAHWRQLPGWIQTSAVATEGERTIAILWVITPPATTKQQSDLIAGVFPPRLCAPCSGPPNQQRLEFAESTDGLQTWNELHPGGPAAGDAIFQLWSAPDTGDLLASNGNGALWQSVDGGMTWARVNALDVQISLGRWLAGQNTWMLCSSQGQPPASACSTDLGKTWRQVPVIVHTLRCGSCGKGGTPLSSDFPCYVEAIASDGALFTACPSDGSPLDSGDSDTFTAYLLAPRATAWTTLGSVPSAFCAAAANDILWCSVGQGGWDYAALPVL